MFGKDSCVSLNRNLTAENTEIAETEFVFLKDSASSTTPAVKLRSKFAIARHDRQALETSALPGSR